MSKKVLIIRSNEVNPDPRVERIAKVLFSAGYNVDVLGIKFSEGTRTVEKKDYFYLYRLSVIKRYKLKGIFNLYYLLIYQFKLIYWLLNNYKKYDIIHSCDFDTILPVLFIKFLFKKIVIYDIFDFYADMLKRVPNIIKKVIRQLDFYAISKVDAVILVDENRKMQIGGSKPREIEIIYNCPEDLKKFFPMYYKERNRLKIVYTGLLTRERGLFKVINIVKRHPNWEFNIAGSGSDERLILEEIKGLDNINFLGKISYYDALYLVNNNDVVFALYDPQIKNNKFASPNKLFEAMMLSKPVIVNKNTSMEYIVKKYNNGIIVDYNNDGEIEKAFLQLLDEKTYNILSENSRIAYEVEYGWDKMQERLISLYQKFFS